MLKFICRIYGLPDAGDYWLVAFASIMKECRCMKQVFWDLPLFFICVDGRFRDLARTYVEDSLLSVSSVHWNGTGQGAQQEDRDTIQF